MNNSRRPAAPCTHSSETEGGPYYKTIPHDGLTKREYFAGLAMQAMIPVCSKWENSKDQTLHTVAAMASIMYADALLEELDNP